MLKRRMLKRRSSRRTVQSKFAAFTLVEMLIAVALVLLMMVMFASVFEIAGGSIGRMRGLAENDQRARSLQTILKADLDKRTCRWVFPFAANENTGAAGSNIGNRQGYVYISENNPFNQLDDVLQFTVASTVTVRNTDVSPYYGQALNLAPFTYPNQPDADDAQLNPNNTGLSTVAEIAYFVRNGSLYRRQLLIREPLSVAGTNPQPTDGTLQSINGANVFGPIIVTGPPQVPAFQYSPSGPFWNDFDYSAYVIDYYDTNSPPNYVASGAVFLGSNSLDNSGTAFNAIANPSKRFGFSPANVRLHTNNATTVIPGVPKEFRADTGSSDLADFIGRFTLQECSDPNFIYPQGRDSSGDLPTNPVLTLTLDPDDRFVSGFGNGPRRGEDLVLANVHAFDIKVWDELNQSFVNVGDPSLTSANADFALANRYISAIGTLPNPSYGPRITENIPNNAINAVFDTWHPQLNLNNGNDPASSPDPVTGQTAFDDPPFRPLLLKAKSITGVATDVDAWLSNHTYNAGEVVFPSGPPGTFLPSPNTSTPTKLPYGQPFFYRCVIAGTSAATPPVGMTPATANPLLEPTWPPVNGMTVVDGTVTWQAIDNRKPLKAIKLEIRYMDTSSQQMRQLTIIHSFVD